MTAAIVAWVQISSSHQDPAAPPPRGNERGATSALTGVFWGAELSLAKKRLFFVIYSFSGISTQHNSAGSWRDVRSQLSSDAGLIPRAWGQDVGLEDKPHFSMHVSAASTHFASALTFVIQRAFIHKQLCELRCCCITGSVSP